jgi:hypothetical protein
MEIIIIDNRISINELSRLAEHGYGDMVKAVVDIEKGIMAVGGEMHIDMIPTLKSRGSIDKDLWGVKIYPGMSEDQFIVFESLINVKEGNSDEEIKDLEIKEKIRKIIDNLISF